MKLFIISLLIFTAYLSFYEHTSELTSLTSNPEPQEITFTTKDGVLIYGDYYNTGSEYPIILLFHQGGSNGRAEYTPIIPSLLKKNYNILTIDQRQGGQIYGGYNRTVAELKTSYTYCEAYQDLESSLEYVQTLETGPVIIWGSSYSASLAIQLAKKNTESVSAVLAFSPASGGPMQDCRPDPFLENLNTPLLVLRPESELEIGSAKAQFELVEKHGHQTYIARHGTHGSSMLVDNRVEGSVEENWSAVISFIEEATK
ncbi:alpha/beta fold hydrolase [Gracilimonas sp.]|uniref:alpha/beta hydrolase n=1 Tax=Gracilimonas sp. TaxID=1974203 RepID=UPI0032EF2104